MNDNAKLWVAALRSGEYTQCAGRLHLKEPESYCCLGVACDLFRRAGNEININDSGPYVEYNHFSAVPPRRVQRWLGLNEQDGEFYDKAGDLCNLTRLNDVHSWSFKQIADLIESEPEGMFEAVESQ